jgi:hypothetical protein
MIPGMTSVECVEVFYPVFSCWKAGWVSSRALVCREYAALQRAFFTYDNDKLVE